MSDARKRCEDILREDIRYNTEIDILPSEVEIANRLLARPEELLDAYEELHSKLRYNPIGLKVFFNILLSAAAVWSPERMAEARAQRDRLARVNKQIARKAMELAGLLRERSDLHNHSGFVSETHYHVLEVMQEAARGNPRFGMYVSDALRSLRGQFDLKYWPSLPDFVAVLGVDADKANAEAHDPLTAAGTESSRASQADFFKAWFAAIEENTGGGALPRGLKLTDGAYASLANCALGFDVDQIVDAGYVKRLRQRGRDAHRDPDDRV